MKCLIIAIIFTGITPTFADSSLAAELNTAIIDQLVDAAIINPGIFRTRNDLPLYPDNKNQNLAVTNLKISYKAIIESATSTIESSTVKAALIDHPTNISILHNPHDSTPNAPNVTQTFYSEQEKYTTTQIVTTTETSGWYAGSSIKGRFIAGVGIEGPQRTITFAPEGEEVKTDIWFKISAEINSKSSKSTETSSSEEYLSPKTPIVIPSGCKAIVTQLLSEINVSGTYNFVDTLLEPSIEFDSRISPLYPYPPGYASVAAILRTTGSKTIPQRRLTLVPNTDNVTFHGTGNYSIHIGNVYSISYRYDNEDPQPSGYKCIPPTLSQQQKALAKNHRAGYSLMKTKHNQFILMLPPQQLTHDR